MITARLEHSYDKWVDMKLDITNGHYKGLYKKAYKKTSDNGDMTPAWMSYVSSHGRKDFVNAKIPKNGLYCV